MRLFKTGHPIADTVSDLIEELPDDLAEHYNIAYGILRHDLFNQGRPYICFDKGFWGAGHFDGNYRLSLNGTQPLWHENGPSEPHGLELEPWREKKWGGVVLVCPPTRHVMDFFGIKKWSHMRYLQYVPKVSEDEWLLTQVREKGDPTPIDWDNIKAVITFNSTVGFEALRRGIPVISDPHHSTIGSYFMHRENRFELVNRDELFSFCSAHQFRLEQKEKICRLLRYYLEK